MRVSLKEGQVTSKSDLMLEVIAAILMEGKRFH